MRQYHVALKLQVFEPLMWRHRIEVGRHNVHRAALGGAGRRCGRRGLHVGSLDSPDVTAPPAWLGSGASVSRAIVGVLQEAGIDMVFGSPGGNVLPIFAALDECRSSIRTLLVRDESMATVMAQVYGRLTGKPGVVIAQAAFVAARLDRKSTRLNSSPMLLLTESTDGGVLSHHAYQAGTGDYGAWDAQKTFAGHLKQV